VSTNLKVRVWKGLPPATPTNPFPFQKMWLGHCLFCQYRTQYWGFGATLGTMLEHIRRCDGFRYAWLLANRPNDPVSSQTRLPILSGQEQRGGEELFSKSSSLRSGWPDAPVFGFRQRGW
jgi:hypothetical protein